MTDDHDCGLVGELYTAWQWSVFPLWWVEDGRCACPRGADCASPGKHPLTRRGVHDASTDPLTVRTWWRTWPRANVGLPAGANGLAVVDVDPRHRGEESMLRLTRAAKVCGSPLPDTLIASTGGGGQHLVFTAPEDGVRGGANVFGPDMPGIDVRGRGGYIVAPPSLHVSGQRYEWINVLDRPVPWPDVLTFLMRPELNPPPRPQGTARKELDLTMADQYARAALEGECRRVIEAPEGTRNHALNRAAFALGQLVEAGLLDEGVVRAHLSAAACDAGLGVTEIMSTLRSGLRGGSAKPREELRRDQPQ